MINRHVLRSDQCLHCLLRNPNTYGKYGIVYRIQGVKANTVFGNVMEESTKHNYHKGNIFGHIFKSNNLSLQLDHYSLLYLISNGMQRIREAMISHFMICRKHSSNNISYLMVSREHSSNDTSYLMVCREHSSNNISYLMVSPENSPAMTSHIL